MKIIKPAAFLSALFLIGLFALCAVAQNVPRSQVFAVDDAGDTNDAVPGDGVCLDAAGKCTLRAAIQEANTTTLTDAVIFTLPAGSTIPLTLGEITISSNIYIAGPGARKLTVQHTTQPITRVFHVLANAGDYINFRGLTITGGSNAGGGIYVETGNTVFVKDSIIANNRSPVGGGILNEGTLTVTRSLFSGNGSTNSIATGGGIQNQPNATATIINSTFTDNVAAEGGAIYNFGTVKIANSTFYLNRATNAAANILNNSLTPSVYVLNSIIGQLAGAPIFGSLAGNFTSLGNNIVTNASNSTGFTNGVNGDQVSSDDTLNPLLAPLADNGGQSDTFALLEGSPAINQGNNCIRTGNCAAPLNGTFIRTDQRAGFIRSPFGTIDVGAFESDALAGSGRLGFGSADFNTRQAGCLVTVTSANTGEKQTRLTRQFGSYDFNNLLTIDVYVIESKCKRAGASMPLRILDLF